LNLPSTILKSSELDTQVVTGMTDLVELVAAAAEPKEAENHQKTEGGPLLATSNPQNDLQHRHFLCHPKTWEALAQLGMEMKLTCLLSPKLQARRKEKSARRGHGNQNHPAEFASHLSNGPHLARRLAVSQRAVHQAVPIAVAAVPILAWHCWMAAVEARPAKDLRCVLHLLLYQCLLKPNYIKMTMMMLRTWNGRKRTTCAFDLDREAPVGWGNVGQVPWGNRRLTEGDANDRPAEDLQNEKVAEHERNNLQTEGAESNPIVEQSLNRKLVIQIRSRMSELSRKSKPLVNSRNDGSLLLEDLPYPQLSIPRS
jgi:hypothetical protein